MKKIGAQALYVIVLYVIQSSLLPLIAWHEISADLLASSFILMYYPLSFETVPKSLGFVLGQMLFLSDTAWEMDRIF